MTAAALRAARAIECDRRIPICPKYHSTCCVPTWKRQPALHPRCSPPSASRLDDIASRTRRKWGEPRVVNQWLPQRAVDLQGFGSHTGLNPQRSLADSLPTKTVAQNHQSPAIVGRAAESF